MLYLGTRRALTTLTASALLGGLAVHVHAAGKIVPVQLSGAFVFADKDGMKLHTMQPVSGVYIFHDQQSPGTVTKQAAEKPPKGGDAGKVGVKEGTKLKPIRWNQGSEVGWAEESKAQDVIGVDIYALGASNPLGLPAGSLVPSSGGGLGGVRVATRGSFVTITKDDMLGGADKPVNNTSGGSSSSPPGSSPLGQQGQGQDPLSKLLQGLGQGLGQGGQGSQGGQAQQGQATGYTPPNSEALVPRTGTSTTGVVPPSNGVVYDTNGQAVGGDAVASKKSQLSTDDIQGGNARGDASSALPPGQEPAPAQAEEQPAPAAGTSGLGGDMRKREGEEAKPEEGGAKDEGGEGGDDEAGPAKTKRKLATLRGRLMIVRRLAEEGGQASQDETGWGQEWSGEAAPAKAAPRRESSAERLARVEAVIAEWRLQESRHLAGETPPAGRAGPIDPDRFDLWLVENDTWREGQLPSRYRITIPDDAEPLELSHGSWVVLQGRPDSLSPTVAEAATGLPGATQGFRLVRVILSAPQPPAFNAGAGMGAPIAAPQLPSELEGMTPELQAELLGQ